MFGQGVRGCGLHVLNGSRSPRLETRECAPYLLGSSTCQDCRLWNCPSCEFPPDFCGTLVFVAPEICYAMINEEFDPNDVSSTLSTLIGPSTHNIEDPRSAQGSSSKYTDKVDVWSILVILLFYAREGDLPADYDLPNIQLFHEDILEYSQKSIKPS